MPIHPVDVGIVVAYLVVVVVLGWVFARRAGKDLEAYVLGEKGMRWYVLGISHGVSGFEVSGTMWFALVLFAYGVKGALILWIWPVFAMIFRMVYLNRWIRRSNVLTGVEWMQTRFGRDRGGELAHLSVVVYALVGVIGFLTYAFQGIGKFAAPFFAWGYSPEAYAVIILGIAAGYVLLGGLYSVVFIDLLQYLLLVISAVGIAAIAWQQSTPETIEAVVPEGWQRLSVCWRLDVDWSGRIPLLQQQIDRDGWSLFSVFIGMLLIKGWLVSMAGPGPGYGIQRVLATRNPREAALESWWISVAVLMPRFLLIAAVVVLALVHLAPGWTAEYQDADFEQVLPLVIGRYVPVGLTGVALAAFVAAFMSSFSATIHTGTAYLVNDVYKRYIDPAAAPKRYVYVSYLCTIVLVMLGIGFGMFAESITSITKWLVSMLFGGFAAPNLLKWHWWRFNGYGFFAGMLAGVFGAVTIPLVLPGVPPIYGFPIVLLISMTAAVLVCLLTPATRNEVLDRFYLTVRPWGLWGPVQRRLQEQHPDLEPNRDFLRDSFNCAVGIVWQTVIILTPLYLVLRDYGALAWTLLVVAVTSTVLKFTWYDHLGNGDGYLTDVRVTNE